LLGGRLYARKAKREPVGNKEGSPAENFKKTSLPNQAGSKIAPAAKSKQRTTPKKSGGNGHIWIKRPPGSKVHREREKKRRNPQ